MICNTVKKLQRDISLVLEKKDISAAEFSSRGTYVELVKRCTRRGFIKKTDKQGCERGRVTRNRKRQRERSVPTRRGLRQRRPCPSISRQDTQCQKTYSTRSSLNQHKAVHTGKQQWRRRHTRKHQCDQCPKVFGRLFSLRSGRVMC